MRFVTLLLCVAALLCPALAWADPVVIVVDNDNPAHLQPREVGSFLVKALGDDGQPTNAATDYIIWGDGTTTHGSKIPYVAPVPPDTVPISQPPPATDKPTYWGVGWTTVDLVQQHFGSLAPGEIIDDFGLYVQVNESGNPKFITIDALEISIINHETGVPYVTHSLDAWGTDHSVQLLNPAPGANESSFEFRVNGGLRLSIVQPEDIVRLTLGMSDLTAGGEWVWAANPSRLVGEFDMGDLPEDRYPGLTLLQTGAVHAVGDYERIGTLWDKEPDGNPSHMAVGDDLDGADDEDGVVYGEGEYHVTLSVDDSRSGRYSDLDGQELYLDGWVDLNQNGVFEDTGVSGETSEYTEHYQVVENPATWVDEGSNPVNQKTVHVPVPFPAGRRTWYYSRWRLTYGHPNLPSGYAYFGEVEDHLAIPEPATIAILFGGVAMLARRRRRRK